MFIATEISTGVLLTEIGFGSKKIEQFIEYLQTLP